MLNKFGKHLKAVKCIKNSFMFLNPLTLVTDVATLVFLLHPSAHSFCTSLRPNRSSTGHCATRQGYRLWSFLPQGSLRSTQWSFTSSAWPCDLLPASSPSTRRRQKLSSLWFQIRWSTQIQFWLISLNNCTINYTVERKDGVLSYPVVTIWFYCP